MQVKELDSKASTHPGYAIFDAERISRENAARYTSAQRAIIQTAMDLLDNAYYCKNIYANYRKTFIAIKLDGATPRNRKLAEQVDDILTHDRGMVKVVTPQGVIFRLAK